VKIERVETGIPGLDELMEGGFVKGSNNLLAGTTGTCKTIMSCQYILHGLKNGESCLYVTLEQKQDEILGDIARFGWDVEFKKYIEQGKLVVYADFPASLTDLSEAVFNIVKRTSATRFALDSMSIATMGWKTSGMDVGKVRRELYDFLQMLKKMNMTSILIAEVPEMREKALSRLGFEEFLVDSVIIVHYLEYTAGGVPRSLVVRKMRRTSHGTDIYPFELTSKGVVVRKP
jgi:KaiC/GvpD/RAD55 family RecA-like ATPase